MKKINKVLIIDDEDIDCFLHTELLKKLGAANEVIVKKDGKEAMDYLKTGCMNNNYPSLIFVDLYMPNCTGFDFLKEFDALAIPNKYEIAVVILSYSEKADDIIRLNSIGRYHYEHKPLDIEKMENIFHRYFRNIGLENF